MDSVNDRTIEKYRADQRVIGVAGMAKAFPYFPLSDGFDLLLIVSRDAGCTGQQYHYIRDNRRIQERWISKDKLERWILDGTQAEAVHWIAKGEILLDRDMYLETLRRDVLDCPEALRNRKLLNEFAKFLRSYMYAKEYNQQDQSLDAYNCILDAIHSWARIAVIEEGVYPEPMIWRQVKTINPGVYKLYEELTLSGETLKQRIELVLLACEFSVMSKVKECCKPLLELLAGREQAWSLEELRQESVMSEIQDELSLLMSALVKKSLVKEIAFAMNDDVSELELRYTR
ncbi:nucleotidyltransferase-like protein [Paenibacillus ginsengihumi]|uniref:nucleotidyltransferase-like protein n=1 Tax=Paenibacillus ginsengihumi TaxID=431596 RepID=UPI000369C444|nr:nucleotidyltransferase-like protein [Paenibacillus ginsengihumi]